MSGLGLMGLWDSFDVAKRQSLNIDNIYLYVTFYFGMYLEFLNR